MDAQSVNLGWHQTWSSDTAFVHRINHNYIRPTLVVLWTCASEVWPNETVASRVGRHLLLTNGDNWVPLQSLSRRIEAHWLTHHLILEVRVQHMKLKSNGYLYTLGFLPVLELRPWVGSSSVKTVGRLFLRGLSMSNRQSPREHSGHWGQKGKSLDKGREDDQSQDHKSTAVSQQSVRIKMYKICKYYSAK